MGDPGTPGSHVAGTTDLNNIRGSIDALAAAVRDLVRVEAMRGANETRQVKAEPICGASALRNVFNRIP